MKPRLVPHCAGSSDLLLNVSSILISICHCYDCICLVLPRWHSYSRKYQGHKGFEPRQKDQKLVQIWAGLHFTVPSEQQKPISNQYLQIFVIYLDLFSIFEKMNKENRL